MVSFGRDQRLIDEHFLTPFLNQSWIFCVDNKLFSSALFEYYLDLFSASRIKTLNSESEANKERLDSSKADNWTLDYINNYGQRLGLAIDQDGSGFIRISEANTFTKKIPAGWSLPQWCAYTVAGSYIVYLDPRLLIWCI
jgi:hypothetical protein